MPSLSCSTLLALVSSFPRRRESTAAPFADLDSRLRGNDEWTRYWRLAGEQIAACAGMAWRLLLRLFYGAALLAARLTLKPQTSNLKPQTSNLKPQTSNLKPFLVFFCALCVISAPSAFFPRFALPLCIKPAHHAQPRPIHARAGRRVGRGCGQLARIRGFWRVRAFAFRVF